MFQDEVEFDLIFFSIFYFFIPILKYSDSMGMMYFRKTLFMWK